MLLSFVTYILMPSSHGKDILNILAIRRTYINISLVCISIFYLLQGCLGENIPLSHGKNGFGADKTIDDRRCWGLKTGPDRASGWPPRIFLLGSPVMEQCPVTTLPKIVKSPRWIIWYHGSSRYIRTLQSAITTSTTSSWPSPGRCVSVTFPPVMGAAVGCRWRKRQAILVWCCFYKFLSSMIL